MLGIKQIWTDSYAMEEHKELKQVDIDNLNKELIEMGEIIQHANLVDNKGIN